MSRVEEHLPLVHTIVRNFCKGRQRGSDFYDEALSTAMLHLCECDRKYKKSDPSFGGYVTMTIRGELLNLACGKSKDQFSSMKKLKTASAKLGKHFLSEESAEEAGLSSLQLRNIFRYVSLHEPTRLLGKSDIDAHTLPCRQYTHAPEIEQEETIKKLFKLGKLNKRERLLVRRIAIEGVLANSMSKRLKTSTFTISKQYNSGLNKLKEVLHNGQAEV